MTSLSENERIEILMMIGDRKRNFAEVLTNFQISGFKNISAFL